MVDPELGPLSLDERMVWAAAYAVAYAESRESYHEPSGGDALEAVIAADAAVIGLQRARGRLESPPAQALPRVTLDGHDD